MKRTVALLSVLLVACAHAPSKRPLASSAAVAAPAKKAGVRGKLVDPPRVAHVRALGPDGKPGAAVAVAADGSFDLPLTGTPDSLVRVQVTGIDRRPEILAIALKEIPVEVTVRLATVALPSKIKAVGVVVYDGDGDGKSQILERQPEGTFTTTLTLTDGKHRYRIWGLNDDGEALNGVSDNYEIAENGSYYSILEVKGGKASFVVDPTKIPAARTPSEVSFGAPAGPSAGMTDLLRRVAAQREAVMTRAYAALDRGENPEVVLGSDPWSDLRTYLAGVARDNPELIVRNVASIAYFQEGRFSRPTENEKALAAAILDRISPAGPEWGLFPTAPHVLEAAADDPRRDSYGAELRTKQPDPTAVAVYLAAALSQEKDKGKARDIYRELMGPRFKGTIEQAIARTQDPDRATVPGSQIPPFELPPLDPKAKVVTAQTLAGKVYLIDVWATWCKPCVAELPNIHELYARYAKPKDANKKGFEILSVSLDSSSEDVVKFRGDKAHPMPWLHGFPGKDMKQVSLLTGSDSPPVPFYILVGADGKVIASSPELIPAALQQLIERAVTP